MPERVSSPHSVQDDFDLVRQTVKSYGGKARRDALDRIEARLVALNVERLGLVEQFESARDWYRDHVNEEGWYDESMWGDPFAISPQLRAALTSNPASGSNVSTERP